MRVCRMHAQVVNVAQFCTAIVAFITAALARAATIFVTLAINVFVCQSQKNSPVAVKRVAWRTTVVVSSTRAGYAPIVSIRVASRTSASAPLIAPTKYVDPMVAVATVAQDVPTLINAIETAINVAKTRRMEPSAFREGSATPVFYEYRFAPVVL